MEQLRKILAALSMRQRISIVLAAVIVVGGLVAFTHWRKESDFKPLYTSLGPEDAAAVIQKLKETNIEYRISESGTSVSAPSARVAELRLSMAAAGIPKTGRIGYELFDKTNFGATEFTEHLNYHRALEGELERSIAGISAVEQARVHVTLPKDSVFTDSRQPAKASVLLKIRLGTKISPENVAAITNLVASAVEGLSPEAISVLDMRGNLLSRPRRPTNGEQPSEATLEYKQKIENDLLNKINTTLDPLLGVDRYRAGISVDCDFSTAEQSEETLDPNKSVMVTSVKSEEQAGANLASGQPGTSSALPRPVARAGSSGTDVSRRTENIAYQSSRVVRHVKLPQGTVKRMSISLLVDNTPKVEGLGAKAHLVLVPPSPETLKVIHDLVVAATGFSVERGDQIVVDTLPFESTKNFEITSPAERTANRPVDPRIPGWLAPYIRDSKTLLIAAGVGALILLLFVVFAMRLIGKKKRSAAAALPGSIPGNEKSAGELSQTSPNYGAEDMKKKIEDQLAEQAILQNRLEQEVMNTLNIPVATTKKAEILIKILRENAVKDSSGTVNVIRTWLADSDRPQR